jgi:hypothetical protein
MCNGVQDTDSISRSTLTEPVFRHFLPECGIQHRKKWVFHGRPQKQWVSGQV